MKTAENVEKALRYLSTLNRAAACSEVGQALWGTKYRKPQAYCRPAGKLLNFMMGDGLVHRQKGGYLITYKGRELLKDPVR